jgi:hypothetical protein
MADVAIALVPAATIPRSTVTADPFDNRPAHATALAVNDHDTLHRFNLLALPVICFIIS